MKKRGVVKFAAITFLTLLMGLPAQANERRFTAATPVVVLMPHLLANVDLLEITPEQRHQIRLIANKMSAEREDNDSLGLELRRELAELTLLYRPDAQKQAEIMALLAKTETRRVAMSVECADGLRNTLNEEQWNLLLELAQEAQGR